MEANRCAAICVNGRHCSKPANPTYRDLCTQHGKMEAGGQHLNRIQPEARAEPPVAAQGPRATRPPILRAAPPQPEPQRDAAARVIQNAARNAIQPAPARMAGQAAAARRVFLEERLAALEAQLAAEQAEAQVEVQFRERVRAQVQQEENLMPFEAAAVNQAARMLNDLNPEQFQNLQGNFMAMLRDFMVRERVQEDPQTRLDREIIEGRKVFEKRFEEKIHCASRLGTDCPVCMCPVGVDETDFGLPCGHEMHMSCGVDLCKNACPMCRAEFHCLRVKSDETRDVVWQIKLRMIKEESERRIAHEEASERVVRELTQPVQEESESEGDDEELVEELPEAGSPAYDDIIAVAVECFMNNPEFQLDPGAFHDRLHGVLGLTNCEFIDELVGRVLSLN